MHIMQFFAGVGVYPLLFRNKSSVLWTANIFVICNFLYIALAGSPTNDRRFEVLATFTFPSELPLNLLWRNSVRLSRPRGNFLLRKLYQGSPRPPPGVVKSPLVSYLINCLKPQTATEWLAVLIRWWRRGSVNTHSDYLRHPGTRAATMSSNFRHTLWHTGIHNYFSRRAISSGTTPFFCVSVPRRTEGLTQGRESNF